MTNKGHDTLNPEDWWIYDKLVLSQKLGYICGSPGENVPSPGQYIVRPRMNILGMGRGAEFITLDSSTDHLPPKSFWCETFHGIHRTVDYVNGKQINCFRGFRHQMRPLYKWNKWVRTNDKIPYPSILNKVFPVVNCEFIGDNIIEIHFRLNPDARYGTDWLIPVWEDEDTTAPEGMLFIEDKDFLRLGFFIPVDFSSGPLAQLVRAGDSFENL